MRFCSSHSHFFLAFLDYVYDGKVEFNEETAMELIAYCKKIEYTSLKGECEKILAESLKIENILIIYETAKVVEAQKLMEAIMSFIKSNIREINMKIGFKNLSKDLLIELLEEQLR